YQYLKARSAAVRGIRRLVRLYVKSLGRNRFRDEFVEAKVQQIYGKEKSRAVKGVLRSRVSKNLTPGDRQQYDHDFWKFLIPFIKDQVKDPNIKKSLLTAYFYGDYFRLEDIREKSEKGAELDHQYSVRMVILLRN